MRWRDRLVIGGILYYLLPMTIRSGEVPVGVGFCSGGVPTGAACETIAMPPPARLASLSKSHGPTPFFNDSRRISIIELTATVKAGSEFGLNPTSNPLAALPPPLGRVMFSSQPPLAKQSKIKVLNWVISLVSPKTVMSAVCPANGRKRETIRFTWDGVMVRSANISANCSSSCFLARSACAARSFALAISRRKPSALALASADSFRTIAVSRWDSARCDSASAAFSVALAASAWALAIKVRACAVSASNTAARSLAFPARSSADDISRDSFRSLTRFSSDSASARSFVNEASWCCTKNNAILTKIAAPMNHKYASCQNFSLLLTSLIRELKEWICSSSVPERFVLSMFLVGAVIITIIINETTNIRRP